MKPSLTARPVLTSLVLSALVAGTLTTFAPVTARAQANSNTRSASQSSGKAIAKDLKRLHLALALKLELARSKNLMCEVDAYAADLIEELAKFSTDKAELQSVAKSHPEIVKDLGTNFAFRKVMLGGGSAVYLSPADLSRALEGSIFYSRFGGVAGPKARYELKANGVVRVGRLNWSEKGVSYDYTETRYSVKRADDKILITIDRAVANSDESGSGGNQNSKPMTYELSRDGGRIGEDVLLPVGKDGAEGFTTSSMECEV